MGEDGAAERESGTDLPECAFADDLEQPEMKEGNLAVEVDGLRAAANSPHSVVKGEEEGEDRFRTAAVGQKWITTGL